MRKYLVRNVITGEYLLLGGFEPMNKFYKAIGVWQTKGFNEERKTIIEKANSYGNRPR